MLSRAYAGSTTSMQASEKSARAGTMARHESQACIEKVNEFIKRNA